MARNLLRRMVAKISCHLSLSNIGFNIVVLSVLHDQTVF